MMINENYFQLTVKASKIFGKRFTVWKTTYGFPNHEKW